MNIEPQKIKIMDKYNRILKWKMNLDKYKWLIYYQNNVLFHKYNFDKLNIKSKKKMYKEIIKLFNDYQDKSFWSFCKILNEKYCELFYYIYNILFEKIGYNYIDKANMMLDLE